MYDYKRVESFFFFKELNQICSNLIFHFKKKMILNKYFVKVISKSMVSKDKD